MKLEEITKNRNEELNELRLKAKQSIEANSFKLVKTLKQINEKIDVITSNNYEEIKPILISFEEALLYEFDKLYKTEDGIEFKLKIKSDTQIQFICYMQAGSTFLKHYHNCLEVTKVLKGELVEWSRCKILKEGESISYAEGEVHSPSTNIDSVWEVNLYKL